MLMDFLYSWLIFVLVNRSRRNKQLYIERLSPMLPSIAFRHFQSSQVYFLILCDRKRIHHLTRLRFLNSLGVPHYQMVSIWSFVYNSDTNITVYPRMLRHYYTNGSLLNVRQEDTE